MISRLSLQKSKHRRKTIQPVPKKEDKDDPTKDYEYSSGQLYNLIDKGQEALNGALEVAQESGHPRAYEVAVNAMKQVADTTDKLIDLQKKMKDLEAPTKGPAQQHHKQSICW